MLRQLRVESFASALGPVRTWLRLHHSRVADVRRAGRRALPNTSPRRPGATPWGRWPRQEGTSTRGSESQTCAQNSGALEAPRSCARNRWPSARLSWALRPAKARARCSRVAAELGERQDAKDPPRTAALWREKRGQALLRTYYGGVHRGRGGRPSAALAPPERSTMPLCGWGESDRCGTGATAPRQRLSEARGATQERDRKGKRMRHLSFAKRSHPVGHTWGDTATRMLTSETVLRNIALRRPGVQDAARKATTRVEGSTLKGARAPVECADTAARRARIGPHVGEKLAGQLLHRVSAATELLQT
eukprot:scaffold2114_cov253-Pinguiococcus_pyrenoidosus.AAC.33